MSLTRASTTTPCPRPLNHMCQCRPTQSPSPHVAPLEPSPSLEPLEPSPSFPHALLHHPAFNVALPHAIPLPTSYATMSRINTMLGNHDQCPPVSPRSPHVPSNALVVTPLPRSHDRPLLLLFACVCLPVAPIHSCVC
jgi:hypothetical protein